MKKTAKKRTAPVGLIVAALLGMYVLKGRAPEQHLAQAAPAVFDYHSAKRPPDGTAGQVIIDFDRAARLAEEAREAEEAEKAKQRQQHAPQHEQQRQHQQPQRQHERPQERTHPDGPYEIAPYQVTGVKIVDINTGRTLPIETVDIRPTIERIKAGERNRHRNDGTVFRNAQHRLPRHPSGYYHEYVVPTHGVRGPGPQRLIIGKNGEMYYTFDHYDTFIQLHGGN